MPIKPVVVNCAHCGGKMMKLYTNQRYHPKCAALVRDKSLVKSEGKRREARWAKAAEKDCENCGKPLPPRMRVLKKFCNTLCKLEGNAKQKKAERKAARAKWKCKRCGDPMGDRGYLYHPECHRANERDRSRLNFRRIMERKREAEHVSVNEGAKNAAPRL